MATKLIRAKGGTGENTVDINSIQVPDLWHIAQYLKGLKDKQMNAAGDEILETWYLAHDMKRALHIGDNLV